MDGVQAIVCPACAGMIRLKTGKTATLTSLPRMRGDDPDGIMKERRMAAFAPHARG